MVTKQKKNDNIWNAFRFPGNIQCFRRLFWKKVGGNGQRAEKDIDILISMCYNLVTLILEKNRYD